MANLPVTGFSAAAALDGTEPSYAQQGGLDVRVTSAQYATLARLGVIQGQCQLSKVSTNLVLSPFNGNRLMINSRSEFIPDAGVSLAPTSLSVSTNYFIYAYMSGATMTLEASVTAYSVQTGTGVKVKSSDASRSLVGYARTTAATAWVDTATERYVRSYYNDPGITLLANLTIPRASSILSWNEIHAETRCSFLAWSNEIFDFTMQTSHLASVDGGLSFQGIGYDGSSPASSDYVFNYAAFANYYSSSTIRSIKTGLSQSNHYATFMVQVGSGNAETWTASSYLMGTSRR